MGWGNRPRSIATAKDLKARLKHHAEHAHDGKPSDDCLGCQEMIKLIKKRETEEKR